MKTCKHCQECKPLNRFYPNQTSKNPEARQSRCMDCYSAYYRERYRKRKAQAC